MKMIKFRSVSGHLLAMMVCLDMMDHILKRAEEENLITARMFVALIVGRFCQGFEARACKEFDNEDYLLDSRLMMMICDTMIFPKVIIMIYECLYALL